MCKESSGARRDREAQASWGIKEAAPIRALTAEAAIVALRAALCRWKARKIS
jgi:hypothetical protein